MDPETQDATSDPSAEGTQATTQPASAAPPVTGASGATDPPLQNIRGEFNRRFGGLESKVDAIVQFLTAQPTQPTSATPTKASGEVTDEDLWRAAQQGDRHAFETYQQRIADRRISARLGAERQTSLVDTQLNTVMAKYPMLRDPSHPLTQTANAAYTLLVTRQGRRPGKATLLEAAMTAVTDRPDLVAAEYSRAAQAGNQARRTATQSAQSGQMGASHRASPANPGPMKVGEGEKELAKRMGIKDPAKSKERFLKRQQEGQSSLGAVSAFVHEEEF